MMLACSKCNSTYDELNQSMICPHNLFPKWCSIHRRYCGNLKCEEELEVQQYGKQVDIINIEGEVVK